ncbi:hypothetical protein PFISCL1PPCAC_26753, partial [Pristionchus fissidentatus]
STVSSRGGRSPLQSGGATASKEEERGRMINAVIMPWRLLFLAAFSVLVTASFPQPSPGVRSPSNCVQLNKTDEVAGITSLNDVLAVASRFRVTIHSILGSRQLCRKIDEFELPSPIDKFTEFKLLNSTSVFFCDTQRCFYCRFKDVHICRELFITVTEKGYSNEISQAAATQTEDGNRILLRIVYSGGKAALFMYAEPLLDEERIVPMSTALDVPFLEQQHIADGFNVDGYSYFVYSSFQPHEPTAGKQKREKAHHVKVMRLCDGDTTPKLESRIEVHLACEGVDESTNRGVSSAKYSTVDKKLFVVFATSTTDDVICSYAIDEIYDEMENTWDICQNVTWPISNTCQYFGKGEILPKNCQIFSRMGDNSRSLPCSRYAADSEKNFTNCRLQEYSQTAYRYSWLESYLELKGTPVALMDNRGHKYNQLFVDDWHSALFFTGDDRMARLPAHFDGSENAKKRSVPSLIEFYKPSSKFALSHVTSDSFMLIDHDKVEEHDISCPSLFPSCDSLSKGGFSDPMQCMFCAQTEDENGGYVMDRNEKNSCKGVPLYSTCPPVIREAYQHSVRKEQWVISGESLQNLNNPTVLVCDQPCDIDPSSASEKSLTCSLKSSSVLDSTCTVQFVGQVEKQRYAVSPIVSKRDSATQTQPVTSNSAAQQGTMSRTWKIVIGVVSGLLIIAIIIVIILCARKYLGVSSQLPMRNQKGDGSIGVPFETINSYPRNAARNTYLSTDPSGMPFANNVSPTHAPLYERLFGAIDDRLKIPLEQLLLEKQIGKGHFGVVLKGTYNPPEGEPKSVACKTLTGYVTGGISEFVNEGLMMDRFNHPRVMNLVGISFNEERMPILITDYMENGDLAKYLRDVQNKPTLRDLLNFTYEIAQGMQYLHENKFIHRDLAARNCMLDRNIHVKIADFGLCREATSQEADEYLTVHVGREMPLRWMALEALEKEHFTMAGDVWSFGVVIWEIMTRGMNPYTNMQAYALFEFLKSGRRLGQPDFCPEILYNRVMLKCWHGEPTLRPTFKELPAQIEEIINILSSNSRVEMNAEYEQCNSIRNSRAASSTTTTPITHHAISHVHSLPLENSPEPTPV